MSLDPWLYKNITHVGYIRHFITGCICGFYICICVFVTVVTVQNIIFDVPGPLAFQKYCIIRVYKVFRVWWQTNKRQPGEPRASPLVEQWTELTFAIVSAQTEMKIWKFHGRNNLEQSPLNVENKFYTLRIWGLIQGSILKCLYMYIWKKGHKMFKKHFEICHKSLETLNMF